MRNTERLDAVGQQLPSGCIDVKRLAIGRRVTAELPCVCDKVVDLRKSLARNSVSGYGCPGVTITTGRGSSRPFTRVKVCCKVSCGISNVMQHRVTRGKVLAKPIDVTNVQMYLHVIWPIEGDAVTKLELDDARERSVCIIDQLQQRCINALALANN